MSKQQGKEQNNYVLSYVIELGTICEFVKGIVFQFTVLHTNMECQMFYYHFL